MEPQGFSSSVRLLALPLFIWCGLLGNVHAQGPLIDRIDDVTMKSCPYTSCTGSNVQLNVGHTGTNYNIDTLTVSIVVSPPESAANSPVSEWQWVKNTGAQRVIIIFANGRKSGTSRFTVTVRDDQAQETVKDFQVIVQPLAPVFDDVGPTRTVVDLKTIIGTPTFPYNFLAGHEDPLLTDTLVLTAFSSQATIIPNNCCGDTPQYQADGGVLLSLDAYDPSEGLSFVAGQLSTPARKATIQVQPTSTQFGEVTLTFRLTDGNLTTLSPITISVLDRPQLESFCSYDVLELDTLESIADHYGMHWMTLFMLNNHSLPHPDNLVPGTRLSVGRPYIVRKGDSLYSIATRFGTTWQHVRALNTALILDEKNLFEGQLLCVAPDLAFISCRHR